MTPAAGDPLSWLAALATVGALALYELRLLLLQRKSPDRLARLAHANLRDDWFSAVSRHGGSEILAVQTLRNALMSATMTASTAVLGLMGTATLAAPSLHASFGDAASTHVLHFTPQLAMALALLALLFASLVCSATAVRYYNHAGFIVGMPVDSEERRRWAGVGTRYLRRAGFLYSWGLRHLLMVAPLLAFILHPWAGPAAALAMLVVMARFDAFHAAG